MKVVAVLLLVIGLYVVPDPMFAHHAEANYDHETVYVVKGIVTRFEFVNPHVALRFEVKNKKGESEQWVSFGASPNADRRAGWTPSTIKPGDEIIVTGFRDVNGRNIMQMAVVVVNGKTYERTTATAFRQLKAWEDRNANKPHQYYNYN